MEPAKQRAIAQLTLDYYRLSDERAVLDDKLEKLRGELAQLGAKVGGKGAKSAKPCPVCSVENKRIRWGYYCKAHEAQHKPKKATAKAKKATTKAK